MNKNEKYIPEIISPLRSKTVAVPKSIYKASGIKILKKRIKSLVFSTDVSIISNCNADAVMAVYPFTPTMAISQSIIQVASNPVFVGVGGGLTSGPRVINLAMHADFLGAYGIVVNSPIPNERIREMNEVLDIPIIASVVSFNDDIEGKINAGADILNVSGGKNTIELVKQIREKVGDEFPIIATGGPTEELISQTIEAGANAITFTPPTSGEIFSKIMQNYRTIKREENK
ncbi:MAG: hydrolase [Tissierellia bacterium]|nr:hydrolase [Tissierellia bacterium]